MNFFRAVLFSVFFYSTTALMGVLGLPILLMPARYASKLGSLWGRCVHLCLFIIPIGFSLKGDIIKSEQVIYAVKHQSAWETLILYWQLDSPIVVLKKELLSIPIVGQFMKRAGCIAVDRSAGMRALKKLQEEALLAKQTGRSILIFPQGTRVEPRDNTTPYQIGVFSLYQALSIPVIPVALNSGRYWPNKRFLKNPGIIDVIFMSPIKTGLPRKEFMAKLKSDIEDKCAELEKKRI
jgi:1-acyl-sn-glycerol-3-phosphate acyltransferase